MLALLYDLTVCGCRHLYEFVIGVPAHPRGRPRVLASTVPEGASVVPARTAGRLALSRRCQHSARLAAGLAGTLRLLDCVAGTFPEGASAVPARTAG